MTDESTTSRTVAEMKVAQNSEEALRLQIAQRRYYDRAKRWTAVRWFGMVLVGIGAPAMAVLIPSMAVLAGAIAGCWIFLGRTFLASIEEQNTLKAASIQEKFDALVFGLSLRSRRSTLPSLEEIASIAGPDEDLLETATKERLTDWYHFNPKNEPLRAAALCQRTNASYSSSLLKTTARVWAAATILWVFGLIAATLAVDLSASEFLLGIVFPVLPALLDISQYLQQLRQSAELRRGLTHGIEDELADSIALGEVLVWQERLFELRRASPEVPNVLYRIKRKENERSMISAVNQLSVETEELN